MLKKFKQCGVSYHNALKKIFGIPNSLTFEYFIIFKCLKFLYLLSK